MPGPCPQPIALTESQQEILEHLRRCTASAQGLVRHACIVLASAEGYNNEQIALKLGIHWQTVRLWSSKWLAALERLEEAEASSEKVLRESIEDVLADAPRSGRLRLSPRSRSAG